MKGAAGVDNLGSASLPRQAGSSLCHRGFRPCVHRDVSLDPTPGGRALRQFSRSLGCPGTPDATRSAGLSGRSAPGLGPRQVRRRYEPVGPRPGGAPLSGEWPGRLLVPVVRRPRRPGRPEPKVASSHRTTEVKQRRLLGVAQVSRSRPLGAAPSPSSAQVSSEHRGVPCKGAAPGPRGSPSPSESGCLRPHRRRPG